MPEEMKLKEKLRKIQVELKAPKSNRNDFGKYNYRSCEDILEAVKPLLDKYDCTLSIKDDIVLIGDRYYIKAEATLSSGDESMTGTAFAREDESKKGMDASQVTGATSSYARKYALNGLFLIDDSKLEPVADPDTNASQEIKHEDDFITDVERSAMIATMERYGLDTSKVPEKVTKRQYATEMWHLQKMEGSRNEGAGNSKEG